MIYFEISDRTLPVSSEVSNGFYCERRRPPRREGETGITNELLRISEGQETSTSKTNLLTAKKRALNEDDLEHLNNKSAHTHENYCDE